MLDVRCSFSPMGLFQAPLILKFFIHSDDNIPEPFPQMACFPPIGASAKGDLYK